LEENGVRIPGFVRVGRLERDASIFETQVVLTDEQVQILRQWARGRSLPARQVERARLVLMAAEGKQDLEIACEIGISSQKAVRWRKGFLEFLGWPV
jgi:hypothetical protein